MKTAHFDSFAHTVSSEIFGDKAHDTVQGQVERLANFKQNKGDVAIGDKNAPTYFMPAELLAQHAILVFQCDEKIANKIADMKNEQGQPLLVRGKDIDMGDGDTARFVNIWNAKTQDYDCYEEILAERDAKTGFQGTAFYNHADKRLAFSFGGTDFTNVLNDVIVSGGQTLRGKVDQRMAKAIPFTEDAMDKLIARHPEWADECAIDIAGHSTGVNAVALSKYCIESKYGRHVRSQQLMEPFGAINAYINVSTMIAKAEQKSQHVAFNELIDGAHTHKAKQGSFIKWFPRLSQNIGDISLVDTPAKGPITPHLGASMIAGFLSASHEITEHNFVAAPLHIPTSYQQEFNV